MKRPNSLALLTLCAALGVAPAGARGAVLCIGDVTRDQNVMISELMQGVNAVLEKAPPPAAFDANGDNHIMVNELQAGIDNALTSCPSARFVDAECPVPPPPGQDPDRVRCGYLIVPQDRARVDSAAIEIAAMVVPAAGPDPAPDPIVYIDGLGWKTLEGTVPIHTEAVLAPLIARRDIIYFDIRGLGHSRPSFDCPEFDTAAIATVSRNQNAAADAADEGAAYGTCHDRLMAEGNDLTGYTSAAIARDVADLVAALGYDMYNVIGTSYGSRIALTMLRDVPDHLRSVVLELPVPVESNVLADQAAHIQESLELVCEACAADPDCHAAFPEFEQALYDLANQLDTTPLTLSVTDSAGMSHPFILNGDRFLLIATGTLAAPEYIALLPAFMAEVAGGGGNITNLATQLYVTPAPHSEPMEALLGCYEQVAFLTPEIIAAGNVGVDERLAQLMLDFSTQPAIDMCQAYWLPAAPPAIEHEPVMSNVPTLIMAGAVDPITPPHYGEQIAAKLSRGRLITFPAMGHGILNYGGCGAQLDAAFFDDPTAPLDTGCLVDIPPLSFIGF